MPAPLGARTASELHDRVLRAAESALNRYLAEFEEGVDTHALPGHVEKLAALALKLQAGAEPDVTPRAQDLERKRTEADKLRAALEKKQAQR